MRVLGNQLMALFARGLGLPPGFFASETGHAANALRAINYPARDAAALPAQSRAGALPTCLEPGERPRYAPVLAGPHLMAKFRKSVTL